MNRIDIMRSRIRHDLEAVSDPSYRSFSAKLSPDLDPETLIGVRTPQLKAYAKQLAKQEDCELFLQDLPHRYFEENQLHSFIISAIKDYGTCLDYVCRFLPYVNNWAVCDQMSPKVFAKHREELLEQIRIWINAGHTYTVRFAILCLMRWYLDEDFDPAYPRMVSEVRSGEYYVNMMIAWYFATALAKQYDAVIPYLQENRLSVWCHNKTIRKAAESFRITDEQKAYLRTLKR